MRRLFFTLLLASVFSAGVLAADSAQLDKLQGKWQTTRTSEDGQKRTQTIELKKEKLIFQILDSSGEPALTVIANVKLQEAGPFHTLTVSNLKAGQDEDSLEPVEGDRAYVYQLGYQTLTIVSNIDEVREQPPTIDVYKKVSK